MMSSGSNSDWLGPGAFLEYGVRYQALQICAELGSDCVAAWLERWPGTNYVFVRKGNLHGPSSPADCCGSARADLRERYEIAFDGPARDDPQRQ